MTSLTFKLRCSITEDMIKEYIENQQTDGPEEAFKVDD
jgi:hypothetical protein